MRILTHHIHPKHILRTGAIYTISALIIGNIPMQAGTVYAHESDIETLRASIATEIDTRTKESQGVVDSMNSTTQVPASIKQKVLDQNKQDQQALGTVSKQFNSATSTADLQKTAAQLDDQYAHKQFTQQQASIVKDTDTQKDASNQLQSMIDQANTIVQQCKDKQASQNTASSSQDQSTCVNISTSISGGGNGGSINVEDLIQKATKILTSVIAIIASVIALIVAIQSGNTTAVAVLLTTIIGQLEATATMIIEAAQQMAQVITGMGGTPNSGTIANSGSTGGDTSGNTSNSADLLPVGDGKYTTSGAKKGYVYTCSNYAQNLKQGQGGADKRGPWFVNNNTQYDPTKKIHVKGSIKWDNVFSNTVSGGTRTLRTNDVPNNHTTGQFPISSSDPAFQYDRNPNSIKTQSITYNLASNPTPGNPQCIGHEVGVMLNGVLMFNALDERGRDAGAWETQDSCDGHPQNKNEYHYHTLSNCIGAIDAKRVIGFALDGFPITGPQQSDKQLTTNDLDECHGTTSEISLDGKTVNMYHYVMTRDFPYSVSCYRAKAVPPSDV